MSAIGKAAFVALIAVYLLWLVAGLLWPEFREAQALILGVKSCP